MPKKNNTDLVPMKENKLLVDVIIGGFMGALAGIILGLILGPMVEVNLRRALTMTEGSFGDFFTRPICLVLILMSIATIGYGMKKSRIEGQ